MTVCRDCCCGNPGKHPAVDHDAQIERLRSALGPAHRVRTSLCLDVCAQSNVLVVQPAPEARRRGARPVWFGLVLDDVVLDDIAGYVRAGGPGRAPMSPMLELSVITAPGGALGAAGVRA
ncbi:hypothetical protein [Actinoplanes siamensis]|uniref:hypothetical protein n=1 Tax=Actinoplanes siamensis TaxID=1223317 RepID=UPI0019436D03|nr:hypothetical protein [Actinoplanes siamensis]